MENILKNLGFQVYKARGLHKLREDLREEMDFLRSSLDIPDSLFDEFQDVRSTDEYQAAFEKIDPLVTVCVATYNRGDLLVERCINSILAQSHKNLELIVVGDCCTDDTAERVARISDERLKFINLPQRGNYPSDKDLRWMVAGSAPVNYALGIAKGDFITHLDDDDEHESDRIEKLLQLVRHAKADIVWHPFRYETPEGKWKINQAEKFRFAEVTTASVLYHHWFKRIPSDSRSYRYREPGDWNRFRKFRYLGAKAVRHPDPLLIHYKERNQRADGSK